MDPALARSMAERFQVIMRERGRRHVPSNAGLQANSFPFYRQLTRLAETVKQYNSPGLLDEALEVLDLAKLYEDADKSAALDLTLGHQDHLIKALLRWFKEDFFKWVNAPSCDTCSGETDAIGIHAPTPHEKAEGASRVELYCCKTSSESHPPTRFPRYDKISTLLRWRKGRCGEFANVFTMFCIALGSRARWVWNAEDHVWTEVYSNTLGRWIACDACENSFDAPVMYTVGWGKKMSYCLAFSDEGAKDVTRRYVQEKEHSLPRKLIPEPVLRSALAEITQRCRSSLPDNEVKQLEKADQLEEVELQSYHEDTHTVSRAEQKPRQTGTAEWTHERGEDGA